MMMSVVIAVAAVVVMVAGRGLQIFSLILGLRCSRSRHSLYGDFAPGGTEGQHEAEEEDGPAVHGG